MFSWDSALSVITVVIALWALHQTSVQIALSNKQHLFELRLKCYGIVKRLIYIWDCINLEESIDENNMDTSKEVSELFNYFIACHFLDPLKEGVRNGFYPEEQNNIYFDKIYEMDLIIDELNFIFPKRYSEKLRNFIQCYSDFLMNLHEHLFLLMIKEKQDEGKFNLACKCYDVYNFDTIKEMEKQIWGKLFLLRKQIHDNKLLEETEEIIRLDSWGFWQGTGYRMKQFLSPVMNVIRKNGSKNNE